MTGRQSIVISRTSGPGGRIPGVLPSSRFGERVLSTGIPSLDVLIGGGLPIGTICLLEDRHPSKYADLVVKCFVAEGAVYNHHIYVASDKITPEAYIQELPALKAASTSSEMKSSEGQSGDNLKIAWRYAENAHKVTKGQKEAKFEFKKKTSAVELGCKNMHVSEIYRDVGLIPPKTFEVLKEVAGIAKQFELKNGTSNVLRIVFSKCELPALEPNFLIQLRSIVRQTNSVCVLSVSDTHSFGDEVVSAAEFLADYVVRFEVILNDSRKAELGDVDGVCDFVKINSVHSLKPNEPPRDIGFCFRNKRLTFQELHIPPEGETTAQRETSSRGPAILQPSTGCGTMHKGKQIDF